MAHGLKLHTFCTLLWDKRPIWNRDIDKCADDGILTVLEQRTGTPFERVRASTLAAYEGALYERHNAFGNTFWIMPLGIYHRIRRMHGVQYCPSCLEEDKTPYFRRAWRLAFVTVCAKHRRLLLDACPRCDGPVNFHR
ncbi:MAG: TniQ family protein, partial [Acidobacteriota bacterium]|nr:TniQ family protein [Acidobacteriota bacterium]